MSRAAVLGSPIAHSLSPRLHQAAYRELGLDWEYTAIECTEEAFPGFFASAGPDWMGMSLTMPLKEVVFEVVDAVDDLARAVGSANTVFRADAVPGGEWRATNTDITGMVMSLRERGVQSVESACVLGAGATARSALAALVALGATQVDVHARRVEPREDMARLASRLGLQVLTFDLEPRQVETDVVISTLPADAAAPWAQAATTAQVALLDASYHPWPTPLAHTWGQHRSDAPLASGRDMLLWQAVAQVGWMTNRFAAKDLAESDVALGVAEAMRAALES